MSEGGVAGAVAEHAGDFLCAIFGRHGGERGNRAAADNGFADDEMRRGGGRNLRQMGNAEHLAAGTDLAHLRADGMRDFAADVRVDFVEDEHGHFVLRGKGGLEREHHAGNFATGGDGAQRLGGFAGVWREDELNRFEAVGSGFAGSELDFKAGLEEAEVAEMPAHDGGELRRGGDALFGKFGAGGEGVGLGGGDLGLEIRAAGDLGAELGEAGGAFVAVSDHLGEGAAVFALEGLEQVETALDASQRLGIGLDAVAVTHDGAGEIADLLGKRGVACREIGLRRVEAGKFAQQAGDLAHAIRDGIFGLAERLRDAGGQLLQAVGVGRGLLPGKQRVLLVGLERGGPDLPGLMGEEVDLAFAGLGVGVGLRLLALESEPLRAGGAVVGEKFFRAAVGVEQTRLRLAGEEGLVIVRAVEIDQAVANLAEKRERGGRAVDELPARAGGGNDALEEELAVLAGFGTGFLEQRGNRRAGGQRRDGLDDAFRLAGADGGFVGAVAEEKLEPADENGFPRAGLAGDGHEAAGNVPRERFHQGKIADAKRGEHCRGGGEYDSFAGGMKVAAGLEITFLGTGTSQGVPMIACDCAVCRSTDPRDKRMRTAARIRTPEVEFLIDTPPDFRTQALREDLRRVDAVLYTHAHTDHVMGFDDLRRFCETQDREMPVHATPEVIDDLRRIFPFAFAEGGPAFRNYMRPRVEVVAGPFPLGDLLVTPVQLPHGRFETTGYIFSQDSQPRLAYFTDCNAVPPKAVAAARNVDVLVIDALRHRPHPTHLSVDAAIAAARDLGAKRTFFTHMGHDLGHAETEAALPADVRMAFDGLRVSAP